MDYREELDRCENFGDIFELVKKTVEETLGRRRAGLMLVLSEMPMKVGAFHVIGSNAIVANRRLFDKVVKSARSKREVNSFIYSILLHEYLHSLGYVDEKEVRELVYEITKENFGSSHPATSMSIRGPFTFFPEALHLGNSTHGPDIEIVRDFDRSNQTYIS
ncbi:hypothetical protein KEJ26_05610 [Candidatus Bathyarchaeota archaeon]|nr:hypothetical protein [Candidatus Bathyarchaeota archaeon]